MKVAKFVQFLALLIALPGITHAGFRTGEDLYAQCQARLGSLDHAYCLGYIAAAFDALEAGFVVGKTQNAIKVCPPGKIEPQQVRGIVVRYLTNHAEHRRRSPGYYMAVDALIKAWACPTKTTK